MKFHWLINFMAWLEYTINMYSNMKEIRKHLQLFKSNQQDKNRKLKNQNCNQRTSLNKLLNFIPKPEIWEMGEHFWLQYGLTRLYRVFSCRPRSKKIHKLILTWCFRRFSKSVFISRKMHFLKLRRNYVFWEISTFLVFISLVDHNVHIRTKTYINLCLSNVF